ncbi:MAG: PqqD family protein [Clostridia bacterium]|nr:PqqD family protein [Clostridia bacterium]
MRVKEGFVLHTVCDENLVVPIGKATEEFHGMIRLNDTGAFLWKLMDSEFSKETLVTALLSEYDVEQKEAQDTVEAFLNNLIENGIIQK